MSNPKRITGALAEHALLRHSQGASYRKIATELTAMNGGEEISKSTVANFLNDERDLLPEDFAYEVRRTIAEDAPATYQELEHIDLQLAAIADNIRKGRPNAGLKAWPLLVKRQKYLTWKLHLAGVMTAQRPPQPAVVTTVRVETQALPPTRETPALAASATQPAPETPTPEPAQQSGVPGKT